MESELKIDEQPTLRRPVLIAAFRGWNDGGQAATLAAGTLARAWDAKRFAEIDPEGFVDFQATRPLVSLDEGMTRHIEWPETAFHAAAIPGADRDAVILLGVEPNYRWRTFNEFVVGLAARARRRAGRHARRAARRRAAHAGRTGDGSGQRPLARRGARTAAVALRRADGHRRRSARRVPPGRDPVRQPLVGRAALRLARAEPARGQGSLRPSR